MSERSLTEIAADLGRCAAAWEPGARLLGNVEAREIVRLCEGVEGLRAVARSCQDLYALCTMQAGEHAFANGVEMWGLDEGTEQAGRMIDGALHALAAAGLPVPGREHGQAIETDDPFRDA